MKNTCFLMPLFFFFCCSEPSDEQQIMSDALIGSWKNVETHHSISFDAQHTYTLRFNEEHAFSMPYYLEQLEGQTRFVLHDSLMHRVYAYEFMKDNRLRVSFIHPDTHAALEYGVFARMK
ncbi:hypothetical protein WJR50_14685 [Catalinimonas sp. 4WD22]|uniref:hypothetical protein n=1 Tax=Catalinimonas locisalis TaxID=3133978 RepID=UPI0031016916